MKTQFDLLIKGGHVFGPNDWGKVDVGVLNGKVAALGQLNEASADKVVNAKGLIVLPGLIDPHMHIALPLTGTVTLNDFFSGTVAAAHGGVTTIVDFADQRPGELPSVVLEERKGAANEKAVIDYLFTVTLTSADRETLNEVPELAQKGVKSFKFYTIYRKAGIMLEDHQLLRCLEAVAKTGALATVHAESAAIVEWLTEAVLEKGDQGSSGYLATKPDVVEEEAVQRMLAMAELTGARIYFRHLSSARGLEAVRHACERGQDIWVETGPHYLTLDNSVYAQYGGNRFIVHPALRTKADQEALWEGIARGLVSCLGTDHCALSTAQKNEGKDFTEVPGGLPGVDVFLPLMYTSGVTEGRIDLRRLVEVTSTGAALAFGLYPLKGTLQPGSDADLVLLDPELTRVVEAAKLPTGLDWSPYEGFKLKGWPRMVISRGEIIINEGQFLGQAGRGRYLGTL